MWKGRFAQETSALVQRYGESVSFDWRLFAHDIAGSIAHSKGLLKAGILTAEEQQKIETGLLKIRHEIEKGNFEFKESLEDVHMNIESELTKRIGPAGAKLHTARSRNDQIATDVRLYCRSMIDSIIKHTRAMQAALIECAERGSDAVMPGYTHSAASGSRRDALRHDPAFRHRPAGDARKRPAVRVADACSPASPHRCHVRRIQSAPPA